MKKYWQRFYSRGGAFYCDGARQSDCEVLAALNAYEQLKAVYLHAIECVDSVFQDGILPDFLKPGDSKFEGIIKLAHAYKAAKEEVERLKAELEACEASLDDEEVAHVETMSLLARAKAEVERLKAELAACKPKADWREDVDSGGNTKWKLFIDNEWRASMYQLILGNRIVWATTYLPGTYETAESAKAAVEEAMQQSRNA